MAGGSRREAAQVLRPDRAGERIDIGRSDPPATLAPLVDYLWWVEWDTPEPYAQEVIPRPVVHLCAEAWEGEQRLLVHGVPLERFEQHLDGAGRTVAIAFRPGGFRPLLGSDVSALSDRVVPLAEVLAVDDRSVGQFVADPQLPSAEAAAALAAWAAELAPPADPVVDEVAALVERAEADRSITRAQQLADLAGVTLRTLQRQFRSYVGVGPKWVVQRCRLLDVAAAAHGDEPVDWAALAADLGYADQSHLIRHFTALVGRPPASYVAGT